MEVPNKFIVGVRGETIVVGLAMRAAQMTKEDALNLAAYLVAIATRNPEKEFTPILNAVLKS